MVPEYIVVTDQYGKFRLLKYNGINMYDHVERIISAADKDDAIKQFQEMGYSDIWVRG